MQWNTAAAALALALAATRPALASPTCELPPNGESMLTQRAQFLRQVSQLPAQCLKLIVRECSRGADAGLLDFDSAARCSITYEALLQKGFDGDFPALLAWWRSERAAVSP